MNPQRPPRQSLARLPLNAVRAFYFAAMELSFTKAAQHLFVTPAAVSSQVRSLEDLLGYKLFIREPSHLRLTADGQRLLPPVREAMQGLDQTFSQVSASGREAVHLSMLPSFLCSWFLPRLTGGDIAADTPLYLHSSVAAVDLSDTDWDAAIRLGTGQWHNVEATHLFDEWLVPYCDPDTFERYSDLGDMLARALVVSTDSEPWSLWYNHRGLYDIPAPGLWFVDSFAACKYVREAGGVGLGRWSVIADAVATGEVVALTEGALRGDRAFYWCQGQGRSRGGRDLSQLSAAVQDCARRFAREVPFADDLPVVRLPAASFRDGLIYNLAFD